MTRFHFWWLFLSVFGFAHAAIGETADALHYEAPASCPSRTDFVTAVKNRGSDFQTTDPAPHRVLVVQIREQTDGVFGSFSLREGDTTSHEREVQAENCTEVVEALAVVAAIALRADETAAPTAPAVPVVEEPPVTPNPPEPETKTEAPTNFRGRTAWGPQRGIPVEAGTLHTNASRALTLYAGPSVGLIPSVVLPRYDLSIHGALFLTTPGGEQTLLGVTRLRIGALGVSPFGTATHESNDTRTELRGATLGIGLCLTPEYDTTGWVLLGCFEYGGGVLETHVKDFDGTSINKKTHGFGSVGVSAEAQYNFSSLFHVGVKLAWDAYMGEITAERADGTRIFEAATNTGYAALGFGLHF